MTFPNPEYLTHPNVPKPLHGINPRSILGKDWWEVKRREAYAKNNFHCWACGVHKYQAEYHQWLEGHESYDINYKTGQVKLKEIIALCHSCHNFIHSGRMYILYQKGEFSLYKTIDILQHGLEILDNAGLEPFFGTVAIWNALACDQRPGSNDPDVGEDIASWDKWHLLLGGKKYYSKFKDIYDWKKHYE